MELIINNKIRVKDPPPQLKSRLVAKLKIPNPAYAEAQGAGRSLWGINPFIYNFEVMPDDSIMVPRGLRTHLIDLALEMGEPFTTRDERSHFPYREVDSSKIVYRNYQSKAIADLFGYPEGVLVAPAGSGKTVMGLSLIPMTGQPTLWLTHTTALANQAAERAEQFLGDIGNIGLLGSGKWEQGDLLTIGLIQTLIRNPDKLIRMMNDYGLVILDEAHHCPARTFLDVVCNLNPYYFYGLTATPFRRDKLEALMFQALGEKKTVIPIEKVEEEGGIVIPTVKYKQIEQPKVRSNNIQMILRKYVVGNKARTRTIVSDVLAEAIAGKYCIVISDRKNHCEDLYDLISVGWPRTGIATGKYNKKHIEEQVDAFNKNEITVLVTTFALLGEGFDVPFLDRAFVAMPFRSKAKATQLIGRIQRSAKGKKDAVVYDYVDVGIGVLENQFFSKSNDCRLGTYTELGANVEPY